ncbi:LytR/AlgR family response regulator transcription factor [Lacihabitans lacunae]|jgi:two-component system, LytTR family, response regulator|uniref:LytR/AlgR family response regulator transcription factor n=1 Tax=Lacihabitans lacunae TaxID=1028214 RepID=A0ABV7YUY1_9BACT
MNKPNKNPRSNYITFHYNNVFVTLPVEQIVRFEANVNYSLIFTGSGKKYLSSRTLKHYTEKLATKSFVRVHKSHLINSNFAEGVILNGGKSTVLLKFGEKVSISRRKLKEVVEKVGLVN